MRNGAEVEAVEHEVTTTDFRENAKFTAEGGKNAKFREVQETVGNEGSQCSTEREAYGIGSEAKENPRGGLQL
jgi:hypothetical protein